MDFEILREQIIAESKSENDMVRMRELMRTLLGIMPVPLVTISPVFVARARINYDGEIFNSREHLSYNPNADSIALARANNKGQQVFYAAVPSSGDAGRCDKLALLETSLELVMGEKVERQYITLGRWLVKRPLNVVILPFFGKSCDRNPDFKRANEFYLKLIAENTAGLSDAERECAIKALTFISEIFCRNEDKKACYKVSACYFNLVLDVMEKAGAFIDGLVYPSANTEAAGMNIALRKELVDENVLVLDYIVMMAMQRDPSNVKNITFPLVSSEERPGADGKFGFRYIS